MAGRNSYVPDARAFTGEAQDFCFKAFGVSHLFAFGVVCFVHNLLCQILGSF